MRKIKFRYWSESKGEYAIADNMPIIGEDPEQRCFELIPYDDDKWEEYSNSEDKNKEELFVGDIVYYELIDDPYGIICKGKHKIDIDGYGTFVEFDGFHAKFGDFITSLQLSNEWEKIGNINENKELIEAK